MTAQRPTAGAVASQKLGLVSYPHLSKFDSGTENRRQILYQCTEIHSAVRGKVKQCLSPVKGIFHIDQLHFQPMLLNLLPANLKRFSFLFMIYFVLLPILLCGLSENFLKRHHNLFLRKLLIGHQNFPVFHASGGFHHGKLSPCKAYALGGEIIHLSRGAKLYSNYLCHL